MKLIVIPALIFSMLLGPLTQAVLSQPYYKGKIITLIVGSNPGGGVDLNGRTMARFLGKYTPGNPRFIVKNFPGGRGLAACNLLYRRGETDGLTIAACGRSWLVAQVLGNPATKFDATKFEYIGSFGDDDRVFFVRSDTGIRSIDDLKTTKKTVLFGASRTPTSGYLAPELLRRDQKLNIKVIPGFGGGTPGRLLAVERGEIQGNYNAYQSLQRSKSDWLKKNFIRILAKTGRRRNLGKIPQTEDLLSPESNQILRLAQPLWGVPLLVAPGTNSKALRALRQGFEAMVKAPAFVAQAGKLGIILDHIDANGLKRRVNDIMKTPSEVISGFKRITKRK